MNYLGLRQVALLLGGISVCGGVLMLLLAGRKIPRAPAWVFA
jgi:hypothetical protein